jgi:hypothetical protein
MKYIDILCIRLYVDTLCINIERFYIYTDFKELAHMIFKAGYPKSTGHTNRLEAKAVFFHSIQTEFLILESFIFALQQTDCKSTIHTTKGNLCSNLFIIKVNRFEKILSV